LNNTEIKAQALRLYLILTGLFIASLVACNLIFQKFFYWEPLHFLNGLAERPWWDFRFEISVGILPYPITFLITDIISEIYGRKRANQVVLVGLFAAVFVLGIVLLANGVPATSWSPIGDKEFDNVFGLTGIAVGASMLAYLLAQLVDVRIFHFWKNLTKGKHLWLRNNFSTIFSQLIDTATVLLLLCSAGVIDWNLFSVLLLNGFVFKVLVALLDTPILYALTYYARKKFKLGVGEEVEIL
jgi:uncharacterized integral membrane protein (TIGR00697 family)